MTGMLEAHQLEYCSRPCEKDLKRSSSDVECAMLGASPLFFWSLDASGARRVVGTASEVAIETECDEQVVCQDFLGELLYSLSGMRTEVCSLEKKLQEVFDDNTLLLATTYQSRSCRRERKLCGFVHDHFITEGDYVQLTWIESRLKERLNFERLCRSGSR